MKKLLCFSFVLSFGFVFAQITAAEYFFDTDPGVGNGSSLSVSGNTIDQDFSIPTTGLSEGIHKLYIRLINDNGQWSLYDNNVFYVNPSQDNSTQISGAEYFIDTDPGVGNGNSLSVTGNTINQDFSIPTVGLSSGVHKLHIRFLNTDGSWSLYDKRIFYINPNNENTAQIIGAEYFIDTDPGIGNGTALTVTGSQIDQNFNIPTGGLSDGSHKLFIRLINDDGGWSLYDSQLFYLSEGNTNTAFITAAEYFFDLDPGIGNANSLDLDEVENFDTNFNFEVPNDLLEGDHFLYVRVLNTDGVWSIYARSETLSTLAEDEFDWTEIKMYPNPVRDILYFDLKGDQITELKIIDLNGKFISNKIPQNNELDISHLNSGTYLLQIKTKKGGVSKKIIKQ